MAELSQEQIDKLKAAHPGADLQLVTAGGGDREVSVVVKVPGRERWMRFKAQAQDQHRKAVAMEALVVDCVVHPAPAEVAQMLEARPALAETFGTKIAELAGLEETVLSKKL
jgi:hypothetical protein